MAWPGANLAADRRRSIGRLFERRAGGWSDRQGHCRGVSLPFALPSTSVFLSLVLSPFLYLLSLWLISPRWIGWCELTANVLQ